MRVRVRVRVREKGTNKQFDRQRVGRKDRELVRQTDRQGLGK